MDLTYALCLPRDGASVPFVRHLCGSTLRDLGVEDACVDDIELAVSEACSNVLLHAGSGGDEYDVVIALTDASCTIEVRDKGPGSGGTSSGSDVVTAVPEGGRGIHLMRALVDEMKFSSLSSGTVVTLTKKLALHPSSWLAAMAQVARGRDRQPAH